MVKVNICPNFLKQAVIVVMIQYQTWCGLNGFMMAIIIVIMGDCLVSVCNL